MTNTTRHTLRFVATRDGSTDCVQPVIMDAADRAPVSLATDVRRALMLKLATAQADAAEDRAARREAVTAAAVAKRALRKMADERDSLDAVCSDQADQLAAARQEVADLRAQCRTAEQMAAHWQRKAESIAAERDALRRRMVEMDT